MCNGSYGNPFVFWGADKGFKTRDGQYACSETCVRDWNKHVLSSGGNTVSNSPNFSNQNNNGNNSSNSGSFLGSLISNTIKSEEKVESPEVIKAKAEAELLLIQQREKESLEEKERYKKELEEDKAKAKELKEQGKKWLALWTSVGKYGRILIIAGLIILWFLALSANPDKWVLCTVLYCAAISGTAFVGLVIKDSL